MMMTVYRCGKCNRLIRWKKCKATNKEIKELNYPAEYDVPICKKCGVIAGYEVEKQYKVCDVSHA